MAVTPDNPAGSFEQHVRDFEQHLKEYHQRQSELDARNQELDRKIHEANRYAESIVRWQEKFDKKVFGNTRAIEGLTVLYGRQADATEKLVSEFGDLKKVLVKMAKKMGVL